MTDDLTKWPRLLVAGETVTEDQADEILVRTANLCLLDGNDKAWTAVVYRAFGLEAGTYGNATMESIRAVTAELDVLQLGLLYTSRIASSWIGGPHGWCDWDGRIGASTYNIGKWPDRDAVVEDWSKVATAFPFLDFTAQLLGDEGEGPALGQWRIHGGRAREEEPGPLVNAPQELTEIDVLGRLLAGGERGVSEERLKAAVERVRAARTALR